VAFSICSTSINLPQAVNFFKKQDFVKVRNLGLYFHEFRVVFAFNRNRGRVRYLAVLTFPVAGLEAPRNSLEMPSGIMDFGRKSESNVNDIPV
jgi:hypothetical protein